MSAARRLAGLAASKRQPDAARAPADLSVQPRLAVARDVIFIGSPPVDFLSGPGSKPIPRRASSRSFSGLKICAAHGAGYLPSYAARSDAGCTTFPDRCAEVKLAKKPTEYL